MAGPDLLARIDQIAAALQALRDEVAASLPAAEGNGEGTAVPRNFSPHETGISADAADLLDTSSAQERFGIPRNTLALWCRTEGLGVRRGGRWLISIGRLQKHINGK